MNENGIPTPRRKRNLGYTLLLLGFLAMFAGNLLTFAFDLGRATEIAGIILMIVAGSFFGASVAHMALKDK